MGEYAIYNGKQIKIGTCEDMYYLRADQADKVGSVEGSLGPGGELEREIIRFRFPWPDEDHLAPGEFDKHDRGLSLYGLEVPEDLDHHSVQFVARVGYNVCLPCPESDKVPEPLTVHRSGFAGPVKLVQQAWRNGRLVGICECGGCGAKYNLPTIDDVQPVIDVLSRLAGREESRDNASRAEFYSEVRNRLADGYLASA